MWGEVGDDTHLVAETLQPHFSHEHHRLVARREVADNYLLMHHGALHVALAVVGLHVRPMTSASG